MNPQRDSSYLQKLPTIQTIASKRSKKNLSSINLIKKFAMFSKSKSKQSIAIKICGITKISQAKEIARLRVNAIGVIGVKESPRFVEEGKCSMIFNEVEKVSSTIERVLVIANESLENIKNINSRLIPPSIIQLHGDESVEYCKEIKIQYPTIKLWKAFRIRTIEDLRKTKQYEKYIDSFLLDAWDNRNLGGTGNRVPLEFIINKTFNLPWILAGGISSELIPEILSKVHPNGIDASSKLETSPGIKDLSKVKSLVNSIREIN